ncbi:MAG: aminotransferase class I/II-fold pyridoxal phosphate-dependent enzyme [Sphaerobacter sp.]|nr:aminotransferase class I/II-fold pyridoxal phosphate-dependent enzyme [Sphaerobacter sp.]
MLPRGKPDIGWTDLVAAAWRCLRPGDRAAAQRRVEDAWSPADDALACLSVRSGFDLLLQALCLPAGSEILVSAITIRDMTRIIEHHGLVPVPVDLDMATLSVPVAHLERALTPRTRAILVAHLFGSRMPLDDIARFARQHGLLLIEDCAQAFTGRDYRGCPESDACLFSFGPIKTATALGGGIVTVRDRAVLTRMREIQASYPVQSRWRYLKRVGTFGVFKLLAAPLPYRAFTAACRALGREHDAIISGALRGFPGPGLMAKIRQQPATPLLALMERRITRFDPHQIARRRQVGKAAIGALPGLAIPGARAAQHSHWVFPVQAPAPDRLMRQLWRHGFDATRGASSMSVVDPPPDRPELEPCAARRVMDQVLYLPVYPGISPRDLARLARAVAEPPLPDAQPSGRELI